jgi:DNA-binding FadR family transcriptional regulator
MVDWDDEKAVDAFSEKRAMGWLRLYAKISKAIEKGDKEAADAAIAAIRKHEAQDKIYKEKAASAGFLWI